MTTRLWSDFRTASLPAILRVARETMGPEEHGLESVLPEERKRIAGLAYGDVIAHFTDTYHHLYRSNQRIVEMLQEAGFELPAEFLAAAELTLSRRFERELASAMVSREPDAYDSAIAISDEAAQRGYRLDRRDASHAFSRMLETAIATCTRRWEPSAYARALSLLDLGRRLHLDVDLTRAQDTFLLAVEDKHQTCEDDVVLADALGFARIAMTRLARRSRPPQ